MSEHNGLQDVETTDPKHADQIARLFGAAFSGALLYGGGHPTTAENALALYHGCLAWLDKKEMLTLSVQRESFFVENRSVDRSVNLRRIVGYFKRAGMESVTFEKGMLASEMKAFIRALGDIHESPSVTAMEARFSLEKVGHIRINYVSYRRVTADEAIVDKQNVAEFSAVSIRRFLDESGASLESLKNASVEKNDHHVASLAEQLKNFGVKIQDGGALQFFHSSQEMMDAVIKLRRDVTRNIELLRAMGKLSDAGSAVSEELDTLSRETIIRLIREEYRQGAVSIKRLAQVIRRLLPNVKDLKAIIPHLKESLLEDGMSLADYLQLVNSLVRELDNEDLTQGISAAAEEMGVSVDEIVQSIKSDPADSARLVVLASEIRKGAGNDAGQLSSILADYIEKVSRTLSLDAQGDANAQTALRTFESRLLEKIKTHGVNDTVVDQVRRRLASDKRGFELPPGVFDNKVTTFFLDHEIKRYVRYNSPFSALVLSILSIRHLNGAESVATSEEKSQIMSALLSALKKMLRDLDWVGIVLWISDTMPFIILPMTDYRGAKAVKERINGELNKLQVPCCGEVKIPRVVVSALPFDGRKTPDTASFFNSIMGRHQEEINLERR